MGQTHLKTFKTRVKRRLERTESDLNMDIDGDTNKNGRFGLLETGEDEALTLSPQTSPVFSDIGPGNSIGFQGNALMPITSIGSIGTVGSVSAGIDQAIYPYQDAILSPMTSNDSNTTSSKLHPHQDTHEPMLIDQELAKSDGVSPLLSLPIEILYQIVETVYYDENTNSISSNLEKFSKSVPYLSHTIKEISLRFLYKYAIFNRPHSFDKFLHNLKKYPGLGSFVEFMDFQTFTSIGLGRTGRMNQEIQMVTSSTITQALAMCPSLIEFLGSENIQDDIDVTVLDWLFNRLSNLQALDFCGSSSESFLQAFSQLELLDSEKPICNRLLKLSFHDCSNLTIDIFEKIFPKLTNIRRLDLNHTQVSSTTLLHYLPKLARLTHLSLARCSQLNTKDLIAFLVHHPSIANESLQWLNLQIDSNVISPLDEKYLIFTLKNIKAPHLKYLNLGGMPVNGRTLQIIKQKFPELESLSISHANIEVADLNLFMEDNTQIKYLDVANILLISSKGFTVIQILRNYFFQSNLQAIEGDYKTLYDLTGGDYLKIHPNPPTSSLILQTLQDTLPQIWKFYDNQGRRAWLYKLDPSDPEYNEILTSAGKSRTIRSNLVFYDLETGKKIETKERVPEFLKYAGKKINCSIGYFNLNMTKKKSYIKGELLEGNVSRGLVRQRELVD
ncbi:uncharacterized protein KQ657_004903 [Scheffersomyces spartinae]|uniref:Uncharacterized protein n=1 Tax=Scheffersomyces spartinae TaxID=45513 RepID=A0A9P7VAF5_9ASCO|nr:uncharacterized protein KQ657_004903 [Scheffersomyces spartinae]KAG7194193.1 hypothetical protein KQ657_004903 [Scheffersomyces spartinae]